MDATVDLTEFKVTGNYAHYIGVMTHGIATQLNYLQLRALVKAFANAPRGDHFYVLEFDGQKYYAEENGEHGYTLMLPDER